MGRLPFFQFLSELGRREQRIQLQRFDEMVLRRENVHKVFAAGFRKGHIDSYMQMFELNVFDVFYKKFTTPEERRRAKFVRACLLITS